MAFSFPLSLADFFDTLPISRVTFRLSTLNKHSRTRGGEIISAKMGTSLWQGKIEIETVIDRTASRICAALDMLEEAGGTFLLYSYQFQDPVLDPGGVILGAATPSILALPSSPVELRLTGLPAGYGLRRGDPIGFTYGSSPVRYALHRVASATVAADGAGQTSVFNVTPPLRPGAALSAPVKLVKPTIKARIIPGSVQPGTSDHNDLTSGISFEFIQTLGA